MLRNINNVYLKLFKNLDKHITKLFQNYFINIIKTMWHNDIVILI